MKSVIGWLFAAIWRGLLGVFGASPEERAGRAEERAETQAKAIMEVRDAKTVKERIDMVSDAAVDNKLQQWNRRD